MLSYNATGTFCAKVNIFDNWLEFGSFVFCHFFHLSYQSYDFLIQLPIQIKLTFIIDNINDFVHIA